MAKDETKGELLPAKGAPAPADVEEVDQGVVEEAVQRINEIYIRGGLATCRALGDYVLETFFGGDVSVFHKRSGKQASFRSLAARDDLHVSHATLRNAVAVTEQLKLLPADVADALPVSLHRQLLPIPDERTKTRLARRAVKNNLSKREFADLIQKERQKKGGPSRGGRPALPAFYKALREVDNLLEQLGDTEITDEDVARLPREKLGALLDRLMDGPDDLKDIVDAVRKRFEKIAEG